MGEDLVTVATANSPEESAMLRNLLESSGIPVYLTGESSVGTAWPMVGAIGGVKVQVADGDAARARALLERRRWSGAKGEEFPPIRKGRYRRPGEATTPPRLRRSKEDDEEEENPREADARRAMRSAVIGLFFPPLWLITALLLLEVWRGEGRLDGRGRRRAWIGACIAFGVPLAVFLLIAGGFLLGGGRVTADNLDPRTLRHPERMVGVWQWRVVDEAGEGVQEMELRANGRFKYRSTGDGAMEGTGSWGYEDGWFCYRLDRLTKGEWEHRGRTLWVHLEALTEDQMTLNAGAGVVVYRRQGAQP